MTISPIPSNLIPDEMQTSPGLSDPATRPDHSQRQAGSRLAQTATEAGQEREREEWDKRGTGMGQEWNRNGTREEPKWDKNGTGMGQERNRNGTRMEQEWDKNGTGMWFVYPKYQ